MRICRCFRSRRSILRLSVKVVDSGMGVGEKVMKNAKWVLLAMVLGLILYLNLQGRDATMALSNRAAKLLGAVFPAGAAWIQANIRRLGHTMEYFLLGLVCFRCFGWKGLWICAGVSILDQCFKELIPVRHFDAGDLPYDMIGYVLGACAGWLGRKLGKD